MTGILAVETATDACSIAYRVGDEIVERHEILPRRHSQHLFQMLHELLPGGDLARQGIGCIAYGSGPGSFTGLRIAASFAQGLSYACGFPAIPVSTLAVMAQSALLEERVRIDQRVLVILDARINEVYSAVVQFEHGLAKICEGPWVSAPSALPSVSEGALCAVGNGCRYIEALPEPVRVSIDVVCPDILPRASHLLPLAHAALERGEVQQPHEVIPLYVQNEISWKKLSEQGRSA